MTTILSSEYTPEGKAVITSQYGTQWFEDLTETEYKELVMLASSSETKLVPIPSWFPSFRKMVVNDRWKLIINGEDDKLFWSEQEAIDYLQSRNETVFYRIEIVRGHGYYVGKAIPD